MIFTDLKLSAKIKRSLPKGSLFLPYAIDPVIELFAEENGYRILGPKATTRRLLESKSVLNKIKNDLGLPNKTILVSTEQLIPFDDLVNKYGTDHFVLQIENGSSGSGTFFVEGEEEYCKLVASVKSDRNILITPFVDGSTISVNAVVTESQTIVYAPSLQVINQPELAAKMGVFSGVDFSVAQVLTKGELVQLREMVTKIGVEMAGVGFCGLFNVNVMKEGMLLNDLNPRCMGSAQLMSAMQLRGNEILLAGIHILSFLGVQVSLSNETMEGFYVPKQGAFMVLHSIEKNQTIVTGNVPLSLSGDELIENKVLDDKAVVTGGIPQYGKIVSPGAPLLRVFYSKDILDSRFDLNKSIRQKIEQIYTQLNFKNI
jgi:predicted ATP-grasp superfamily ATP-dependent carboligase